MNQVLLDKGALLVANAVADKNENREILKTVRIGNNEIVGVDGFLLVRYPIGADIGETINVPGEILSRTKTTQRSKALLVSNKDENTCTIQGDDDVKRQATLCQGNFPDIGKAYPKGKPKARVSFSRKVLKKLLASTNGDIVDLDLFGEKDPVKFTCGDHHGIIMPLAYRDRSNVH